jgi:valyl-tRNA synthetase
MITGFDILFFWLARMIMFGCHFMQGHQQDAAVKAASGDAQAKNDSVPFRHVYIHMLVRDAERQKMSKTKGNVVDPIEVIQRFGTDATRFTLAAMAAPGTDVAFSESRTDGYRAFANKIWNAARFMFMNVDNVEKGIAEETGVAAEAVGFCASKINDRSGIGLTGFAATTLEDRWILSRFNRTVKVVSDALAIFRFHEAANCIYDFFWGDFCDWFIELIKPRFSRPVGSIQRALASGSPEERAEARAACANLGILFDASLRLLHPVMPFITEEIWHAMYDGKPPLKSIALAAFPRSDEKQFDPTAEKEMEVLQDLVVGVRNWRAEAGVEPKIKVPIRLSAFLPENLGLIEQNQGAVSRLANVKEIGFEDGPLVDTLGARRTKYFVFLPIYRKKLNVADERERLSSELEKIGREIANAERQLGNEQFLAKAPSHVVEGLRERTRDLATKREETIRQLRTLGQ